MQRYNFIFLILFLVVANGCAPTIVSGGNSSSTNTSTTSSKPSTTKNESLNLEDLSEYRPKFDKLNDANAVINDKSSAVSGANTINEGPLHVNKRLDAILDTIATRNKNIKFANGYRIQIYVGNDRKSADDAKIYTYQTFPEIYPYLSYQQPIYKVKVGDFLNRMDAERYYANMKIYYPSAMILPDKVEIKKGMMVK
jgi:hypothetical protein